MSKIETDKINFMDDDYVVEIDCEKKEESVISRFQEEFSQAKTSMYHTKEETAKISFEKILDEAQNKAQKILDEAEVQADEILEKAKIEANDIIKQAQDEAIEKAKIEAEKITAQARLASQKESEDLINSSKDKIEKERIETINNAYKEGYEDGHKKLLEELEDKIKFFDDFCAKEYIVEQNILKAASKEILNIILTISKKILFKEINGEILEKIIENSITLLENKENINIILSEKYAKILYEFQKKSLNNETEFDFKDFKQYKNFNITYGFEYDDDTIIVENIKERLDASVISQLDVIIRNLEEKIQKDKLEIEEYKKNP